MVEVFSAAAAAAPRAMAMLLMVDTKFVPLRLHLLCIGVAVEEYLGNALLSRIKSNQWLFLFGCLKEIAL